MKQDLKIHEIRECSKIKGKQETWISELNDEQLEKLFNMVKKNISAKSIARNIQRDWKIKATSSVHSLSQGILKFKKRVAHLPLWNQAGVSTENESKYEQIELTPSLNSLLKNEEIVHRLRDRINFLMDEERRSGIPNPHISKDVQALTAFEKLVVKQKEYVIKHNNTDPAVILTQERREKHFDNIFNNVLDTYLPTEASRNRMIKVSEKFLELAEKEAMTLSLNDDETKSFIDSKGNVVK